MSAGAYTAATTDPDGNETKYNYYLNSGRLGSVTYPNGQIVTYLYNADGSLRTLGSYDTSINYSYSSGYLSSILTDTESYSFTYDAFGNKLENKVGNSLLSKYNYNSGNGSLSSIAYGNGFAKSYSYTLTGELMNEYENGSMVSYYRYASDGSLQLAKDYVTGITSKYSYDSVGRIVQVSNYKESTNSNNVTDNTSVSSVQYGYDLMNNVTKVVSKIGDVTTTQGYVYECTESGKEQKDGLLSKYTIDNSKNVTYTYDTINRLKESRLDTENEVIRSYVYKDSARTDGNGIRLKTTLLANETIDGRVYSYLYDSVGNITHIYYEEFGDKFLSSRYTYDKKNQLIREDDINKNCTCAYTYDESGNILSSTIYPLTFEDEITSSAYVTIPYTYDTTNGDRLTSYSGSTITYDTIGNPVSYLGYTMEWNGRKLVRAYNDSTDIRYTYDKNGLRSSKTVNGVTTKYTYVDGNLYCEDLGDAQLYYYYDGYGHLTSVKQISSGVTTVYYVACDSRGNVESMYDSYRSINILALHVMI